MLIHGKYIPYLNEFLIPLNEILKHRENYTLYMGKSGDEKTYHLKLGILIHWKSYSLSENIGKYIAYVNT